MLSVSRSCSCRWWSMMASVVAVTSVVVLVVTVAVSVSAAEPNSCERSARVSAEFCRWRSAAAVFRGRSVCDVAVDSPVRESPGCCFSPRAGFVVGCGEAVVVEAVGGSGCLGSGMSVDSSASSSSSSSSSRMSPPAELPLLLSSSDLEPELWLGVAIAPPSRSSSPSELSSSLSMLSSSSSRRRSATWS
ncbi:hypothetical protein GGR56DRAFT_627797 [Xylariaceae sp. FL0804]|nr:hypothetical protein GGR56DRAFT_627797 [Xylariaceae sp. FL0804]